MLIEKLNVLKQKGKKIDLHDVFRDLNISADIKENITFSLVNKSSIEEHDVTLSELLTDRDKPKPSLKPEPPKIQNPRTKPRGFLIKNQKRSFDLDKNDDSRIFTSVDYQNEPELHRQSPPKHRFNSFAGKKAKPTTSNEKDKNIRVRSVTPVYTFKEKLSTFKKKPKNSKKF